MGDPTFGVGVVPSEFSISNSKPGISSAWSMSAAKGANSAGGDGRCALAPGAERRLGTPPPPNARGRDAAATPPRPPQVRPVLDALLRRVVPARALEQRPQEAVQEDRAGRGGGAVLCGCEVQGGGGGCGLAGRAGIEKRIASDAGCVAGSRRRPTR